jgi:hypothetical protein
MEDVIYTMQKYKYERLDVYDANQSKGVNVNNKSDTLSICVVSSEGKINKADL